MKRQLSCLGAAFCAAAAAAVIIAPAASAVLPDRVGWWNKAQQIPAVPAAGAVNLPLPPNVSSDDLPVSNDGTPEGLLIAAVRYEVPPGASAKLTLVDTDNRALSMPPGTSISVCPTTSTWDGLINGRWDARPKYDCEVLSAVSSPNGDGTALSWDIPAAFQMIPGVIDVVLVPSGSPVPFAAVFAGPTDESLILTDVPETFEEGEIAADFASPPPFTGDSGTFASLDPLGGVTDLTGPLPSLSAGGAPTALGASRANRFVPTGSPIGIPDSRAERVLAFLLLAALGAALFWFGGKPARAPRLLGSLGHGQAMPIDPGAVTGVGRFARPRGGR